MRKLLLITVILLVLVAAAAKYLFAVNKTEPQYRAKIVNRAVEPANLQDAEANGPAQLEMPIEAGRSAEHPGPVSAPLASAQQPAVPAAPLQRVAPTVSDPAIDSVMDIMKAGNYQAALEKLKALAEQPGASPERKEKALRKMADCRFHIGSQGSSQDLLKAADLYKEIIKGYPGSREENAVSLYRLAWSYEGLKFYYEARKVYERLAADFPESSNAPEALFRAGAMSYKVRHYSAATDQLRKYIDKHPSGEYLKDSYFMIADCYSQLQRNDISSAWYQEILKRWPEWEKIPPEELYKLGSHYWRSGKCDEAIEILTLMLSMCPDAGKDIEADVCFMIARCLLEKGQPRSALMMLSHIVEKYPESRQEPQAVMLMAGIGVEHASVRIPVFMPGSLANRDPVQAYNDLLFKYPFHDLTEELLFHKGYALYKSGRFEESFATFRYESSQYPQGRFKTQCMTNLLQSAGILMKRAFSRQDFLGVADIFLKIENDYVNAASPDELGMIVQSFHKVGINKEAISLYNSILKSGKVSDTAHLKYKKAECHFFSGELDAAEKLFAEVLENYRKDKVSAANCKKYLGHIALKRRAYDKAVAYYGDALVLAPASGAEFEDGAAVQRNYGLALQAAGFFSKALPHFQHAAALYNSSPGRCGADIAIDSYAGIGECLLQEKRFKESLPYFKRAGESMPGVGEVLWPLLGEGKVYLSMRNTEQADKVFAALREKGGEDFWARIADYTVKENAWDSQYGRFLGK